MLQTITQKVLKDVPTHVDGLDRQMLIAKNVLSLEPKEKDTLQAHFNKFLIYMRDLNASDIELGGTTAGENIWLRIYGKKTPKPELGHFPLEVSDVLCQALVSPKQRERLFKDRATDFSYSLRKNGSMLRWRASLYFDMGHLALNMRAIAEDIYPFSNLGIHPNAAQSLSLAQEKQGLILITGITGSGKSTTLDSIIDANNQSVEGHIVIIGDPIEHIHTSKRCIVRHREVGRDVNSFKEGAIQALRQDPDIIVVGELRDPDTIMTCLEITDTGHKVFSTLHTSSSVETIDRIVAECPGEEQERVRNRLADVLRVVMSQKLVPSIDNKLVLAKEILLVTSSVKAAIRNKNTHEIYQMISESSKLGMITMEQDLYRLFKSRVITESTAYSYANNKSRIQELFYGKA
jgi:twitching motility protein PilT